MVRANHDSCDLHQREQLETDVEGQQLRAAQPCDQKIPKEQYQLENQKMNRALEPVHRVHKVIAGRS